MPTFAISSATKASFTLVGIGAVLIALFQLVAFWSSERSVSAANVRQSGAEVTFPVILLGLPRSGSLALHHYFECHGFASAHYCCGHKVPRATGFPCLGGAGPPCGECILKNLQAHLPAFQECGPPNKGLIQVWSQFDLETNEAWFLPQHFTLGPLHQAYPNATWILNRRDKARDWAESIYHWHSHTRRLLTSFGLGLDTPRAGDKPAASAKVSEAEVKHDMQIQLDARVYNRTEHLRKLVLLERIYLNHSATIRQWASQFREHKYLEINVDDDSSLVILDEAFGFDSVGMGEGKCHWTFSPPTSDWKNFSLPF